MGPTSCIRALASLCLFAGIATAAQTPGFTATTTTTPDAHGFITVTIGNRSNSNITAVSIYHTCDMPGNSKYTWVGLDIALNLSIGSQSTRSGIPVSSSWTFIAFAEQTKCPGGISVFFADGHGEGSPEGLKQILVDRRASYAEFSAVKAIVEGMPPDQTDFSTHLVELLDARRLIVAESRSIEIPREEAHARDRVLNEFLMPLRTSPDRAPKLLSSRTETLQTLDRMMTHLQKFLNTDEATDQDGQNDQTPKSCQAPQPVHNLQTPH